MRSSILVNDQGTNQSVIPELETAREEDKESKLTTQVFDQMEND
jgi:hypothetical protein